MKNYRLCENASHVASPPNQPQPSHFTLSHQRSATFYPRKNKEKVQLDPKINRASAFLLGRLKRFRSRNGTPHFNPQKTNLITGHSRRYFMQTFHYGVEFEKRKNQETQDAADMRAVAVATVNYKAEDKNQHSNLWCELIDLMLVNRNERVWCCFLSGYVRGLN